MAIAVISAVIGARSLSPRELYNEMYPVETLKRDAFRICLDTDRTFVRAVKVDRESCFDSMPHAIEVALGRVRPVSALAANDPVRQAELMLQLVAIPPRQPVTVPRTFGNTELPQAAPSPCAQGGAHPGATAEMAPVAGRLPALGGAGDNRPPITLTESGADHTSAPFNPLSSPDLGDKGLPAIVPLVPGNGCGGGA